MKNDIVELIQRILADDEAAFTELVNKYKKQVHALAWRKTEDFHIAQDITQEVFLKVYQELHALRDPTLFSGWLYVITANLCATWHRKKRIPTQPLEDEEITLQEKDFYSQHVVTERTKTAVETQREVVKKLLAKLKESERTVMTLHYLGEMTIEDISKFIGVSAGTIKSRLQRARNRLQKEETMIKEALEHFQISPNLTDNILKDVTRLKPTTPAASKPLIPWIIASTGAVLIVIMLGISSQFSARFQQPFSLDAQTETTVELIDAPLLPNFDTDPDVHRQLGSSNAPGNTNNSQQNPDEVSLAAAQDDAEDNAVPKNQWIEYERQVFTHPRNLLATPEGELYTLSAGGHLYKLKNDGENWQHINDMSSLEDNFTDAEALMKKWNGILYLVWHHNFYASKDDGKTWDLIHELEVPAEANARDWDPMDLVLTEKAFYLIFAKAAFRSEDQGKTWKDMSDGLPNVPDSITVIQNTLFTKSDNGLFRRNAGKWERLEIPIPEAVDVRSVTGTKDYLYVMASRYVMALKVVMSIKPYFIPDVGHQRTWWILRSTDLGNTWEDITPTNAWPIKGQPPYATLIAAGENILLMEKGMVSSTDAGNTWLPPLKPNVSPSMQSHSPAVVLNDRNIYVGSGDGFQYSSDGGKSWDKIEIPAKRKFTRNITDNLIVYEGSDKSQKVRPAVYAKSWRTIVKTTDKGKSWKSVKLDVPMTAPIRDDQPQILRIETADDTLYAKGKRVPDEVSFYQISDDGNTLEPIKGIPTLKIYSELIVYKMGHIRSNPLDYNDKSLALKDKSYVEELQENFVGATQFFKELAELAQSSSQSQFLHVQIGQMQRELIDRGLNGAFAVSGDTFYLEYNFKLLRWKRGEKEWYDTGVEETIDLTIKGPNGTYLPAGMSLAGVPKGEVLKVFRVMQNFKLAVSGDTVYVGKRDGHLLVSHDRGNNWTDITSRLPHSIIAFKDIKYFGPKVYVATDAGVTMSSNGLQWQAITDAAGENLVMEHLAVDDKWLCGITEKTGVYLLVNGTWEQIVSEIPDKVTSLAIDGNTVYVGTWKRGMLHYNLSE